MVEHPAVNRVVAGSSPACGATGPLVKWLNTPPFHGGIQGFESPTGHHGRLAQLGEHLPYKQGVGGSSPSSSTIRNAMTDEYIFVCLSYTKYVMYLCIHWGVAKR